MDPVPFLFGALVMFGGAQLVAFSLYRRPTDRRTIGIGEVKQRDFLAAPMPRKKRSRAKTTPVGQKNY